MNFKDRIQCFVRHRDSKLYSFAFNLYNKESSLIARTFVLDQVDNIVNGIVILGCIRLESLSSLKRLEVTERILEEL